MINDCYLEFEAPDLSLNFTSGETLKKGSKDLSYNLKAAFIKV
jgi:hypothetical protein